MPQIAIVGGSGFYELLEDADEQHLSTPFGDPSDAVATGKLAGREVAFLPRHGRGHRIPPHRINYRANLWAMRLLGVTRIIGPCACGSLKPDLEPGTFVYPLRQRWFASDTQMGNEPVFADGPEPAIGASRGKVYYHSGLDFDG